MVILFSMIAIPHHHNSLQIQNEAVASAAKMLSTQKEISQEEDVQ
jgi:hypothetical protein